MLSVNYSSQKTMALNSSFQLKKAWLILTTELTNRHNVVLTNSIKRHTTL